MQELLNRTSTIYLLKRQYVDLRDDLIQMINSPRIFACLFTKTACSSSYVTCILNKMLNCKNHKSFFKIFCLNFIYQINNLLIKSIDCHDVDSQRWKNILRITRRGTLFNYEKQPLKGNLPKVNRQCKQLPRLIN